MNFFVKFLKLYRLKAVSYQLNKGMSYVELIVVLSIFAVMTSVILFNYNKFEAKVDIENLANDIALKIVQAQRESVGGKWNNGAVDGWKPSYGIYFDMGSPKQFIYFTDLDNPGSYDGGLEEVKTVAITRNNFISDLQDGSGSHLNKLNVYFKRPNSEAYFTDDAGVDISTDFVKIIISSPNTSDSVTANIIIYKSGRVDIE